MEKIKSPPAREMTKRRCKLLRFPQEEKGAKPMLRDTAKYTTNPVIIEKMNANANRYLETCHKKSQASSVCILSKRFENFNFIKYSHTSHIFLGKLYHPMI